MTSKQQQPVWMTPLSLVNPIEPTEEGYEVLFSKVCKSPVSDGNDSAEIETMLQVFRKKRIPLWRRVVVQSGPASPVHVIHASYMLPQQGNELSQLPTYYSEESILCWASFPDRPEHPLLCVLANPTLLCIWDVYPRNYEEQESSALGGEGVSIPLPFQASTIHAIENGGGLLLQRAETVADRMMFDAQSHEFGLTGDIDEDGFVLKAPPQQPHRLRESIDGSSFGGTLSSGTGYLNDLPSLFSLSHPLDDVLPVSLTLNVDDAYSSQIVTDVAEKVLFVGELHWVDPQATHMEMKEYRRGICVTYNTKRQRHAIWEVRNSPPPPTQPPLWKVSGLYRSNQGERDSHLGAFQQDLGDFELFGESATDASRNYNAASRTEALADALGVRKTPRKADDVAPTSRAGNAARSAARGRHTAAAAAGMNTSVLSPASGRRTSTDTPMMDVDQSVEQSGKPSLLSVGPFASLSPKLAMVCLYEDTSTCAQAEDIFLTSNLDGSGLLEICCLVPSPTTMPDPYELLCFSFSSKDTSMAQNEIVEASLSKIFTVTPNFSLPCVSAQVIQTTTVPLKYRPHVRCRSSQWDRKVSDIIVIQGTENNEKRSMSLYRSSLKLGEVALCLSNMESASDYESHAELIEIENAVEDRVDVVCTGGHNEERCFRIHLSLCNFDSISGRILDAVESVLMDYGRSGIEAALKLRMDCLRQDQSSSLQIFNSTPTPHRVLGQLLLTNLSPQIRQNDEQKEEQSAWGTLMASHYHATHFESDVDFAVLSDSRTHENSGKSLFQSENLDCQSSLVLLGDNEWRPKVFDALHLLYEDLKLHGGPETERQQVATILCTWCKVFSSRNQSARAFLSHYDQDLGGVSPLFSHLTSQDADSGGWTFSSNLTPPCILSWVDGMLTGEDKIVYPSRNVPGLTRTRSMIRIFSLLEAEEEPSKDHIVVRALIEEGFESVSAIRSDLPVGVAVPILEVLNRCRGDDRIDGLTELDAKIWSLVGREDLRQNIRVTNGLDSASRKPVASSGNLTSEQLESLEDIDCDGVSPLEITSSMLFPEDNRIREVGRLVRSSRPVYLCLNRPIEVSDHDFERMKQEKLLLLSRRLLALPIGRSMLTIGNLRPVPAEQLPVPELCLSGRVPPTNAMLALDTAECAQDWKVWPEFHNGVAAGLRLPIGESTAEAISKITRTWIVYNRPSRNDQSQGQANGGSGNNLTALGHGHGGLLMALGLRGHLTTLEMADIFDYLTQGSVTTTVGVLLGMAANMRGSCDIVVSKMLCLHIPSLIPQHFSAIDVASCVQAAAVAGTGLLYQGSSHRMMTEFLLNEIGKRPSSDGNVADREAYTLSCGIALGMVNLCQGNKNENKGGGGNPGLSDLKVEERLYRYIVGGADDMELRRRKDESDRLQPSTGTGLTGGEKCSCVYEGESINTDVTSPGATLAVAMIYMMSGNKTMASAVALPDTHFLLEYVRPDFLLLRVIAKSLILWDDVKPSKQWIDDQLPSAVRSAYTEMRQVAQNAHQNGHNTKKYLSHDFDRQAVRLMYTHVIAGACFSLGLRYAGTGSIDAKAAIFERIIELKLLREGNDPVSCALRPSGPVLEMCLACAAISLSMVLAGTGDLETLKLLKVLRWRCDEAVNHGTHMAYGMAIGLLFLGGGTSTLGRKPEDIAALVMAFYPRFPSTTSDNQYHLQALRNVYALAVRKRVIRTVDVESGSDVFVPIQIHFKGGQLPPLSLLTPCLLCNADSDTDEIRVISERYYPVSMKLNEFDSGKTLFVQRRSAHLTYQQDPNSQLSLSIQGGGRLQGLDSTDLITSFTNNQYALPFAQHFAKLVHSSGDSGPFSVTGFCNRVLYECMMRDTYDALPFYVALRGSILSVKAGKGHFSMYAWDFRLLRSYFAKVENETTTAKQSPILNGELLTYLIELFEAAIHGGSREQQSAMRVFYGAALSQDSSQETKMDVG